MSDRDRVWDGLKFMAQLDVAAAIAVMALRRELGLDEIFVTLPTAAFTLSLAFCMAGLYLLSSTLGYSPDPPPSTKTSALFLTLALALFTSAVIAVVASVLFPL